MQIVSVDPFYLKMPEITNAADGTQDTFLVRIRTDGGVEGWGESDASPLVSMAAYCCPMSHGNIINIRDSLIGETIQDAEDVIRLHAKATRNGLDIQQIHHAYAAADLTLFKAMGMGLSDMALAVDILARAREQGLGHKVPERIKTPPRLI